MQSSKITLFMISILLLTPGCVSPKNTQTENIDSDNTQIENIDSEDSIPEYLNLVAQTAGRDIDRGENLDILGDANGTNTMILWVSTGCSGCHDWTEFIANHMRDGNISNDTRIITVHRYPSFETKDEVIDVYASENRTTESLWPVMIPVEGQPAIDAEKNNETSMTYSEAFENPVTPSLTILNGEGKTIWKNKTYWANQTVFDDAMSKL